MTETVTTLKQTIQITIGLGSKMATLLWTARWRTPPQTTTWQTKGLKIEMRINKRFKKTRTELSTMLQVVVLRTTLISFRDKRKSESLRKRSLRSQLLSSWSRPNAKRTWQGPTVALPKEKFAGLALSTIKNVLRIVKSLE